VRPTLLGPLRVWRTRLAEAEDVTPGKDGEKGSLTIVLLHGFGAPGDDLVGLAPELSSVREGGCGPHVELVFPEALHTLQELMIQSADRIPSEIRAWWMIDLEALERGERGDRSAEVPPGMAAARDAVNAMLDALAAERARQGRSFRLVLGGFSQGAMLAVDVALAKPERALEGLVLLSGTMLAEDLWVPRMAARKGLPVFQSHGRVDTILPYAGGDRLRHELVAAGLDVTFDPFDGPHTIPGPTLRRLSDWLRDRV
jgi:phospholipase/carboxylesterase